MRSPILGSLAVVVIGLTACGADPQNEVADMMLEVLESVAEADDVDMVVDEDCIREKAAVLSDEDAQAIVDAGTEGDPAVSAEAEQIGASMFECVEVAG